MNFLSFIIAIVLGFSALTSSAIKVSAQESPWRLGDHVEVQWQGDWYKAEVIEVKGSQYKIHYEGYAASWDEWIDKSRIRSAGVKQTNPGDANNVARAPSASSPLDHVLQLLKQAQDK